MELLPRIRAGFNVCFQYIEFDKRNYKTFSIELAHLFLTSSSEVDVVAKQLCRLIEPTRKPNNIDEYRLIITTRFPKFSDETIFAQYYGLNSKPWSKFKRDENPIWWQEPQYVKHQHNEFFASAHLKNAINSVGALLIITFYYYLLHLKKPNLKEVGHTLRPESTLIRLNKYYYPSYLMINK